MKLSASLALISSAAVATPADTWQRGFDRPDFHLFEAASRLFHYEVVTF